MSSAFAKRGKFCISLIAMTKHEYEAEKLALIEEIDRAFDGVERGDGVTFHEARVIDDYGSAALRAEARLQDTETRWQDVPDELLVNGDQIISFLDDKGFVYYLPAYLVWYLRFMDCEDDEFSSDTFDSVDFHLLAINREHIEPHYDAIITMHLERFKMLNVTQSKSVAHFLVFQIERLKFLSEQEGEATEMFDRERKTYEAALDVYWRQFLLVEGV